MRRAPAWLVLATAIALGLVIWVGTRPSPPAVTIAPNAAIQNEISRLAAAHSEADVQVSLDRLRALGGAEFSELIPQLVYFLMHATDTREAMMPGVVIDQLKISPAQLRQALEPYRRTSDAQLRAQIDNLLHAAGAS